MALSVPLDMHEITITPVFKHVTVEDVPASEREGHAVMKTLEVVEVRFAGSKLYAPVFPVDAFWKRDGHRLITYQERWAEQYRAFVEGRGQEASGTPLEMLKPYGISDAQLSLCRALRIYSIEALHHLEGQALKSLQMNANVLKDMARSYMADRSSGGAALSEVERLKAELAELRSTLVPKQEPAPEEVEDIIAAADAEFADKSDAELKDLIAARTGRRPMGNPSRATLLASLRGEAA